MTKDERIVMIHEAHERHKRAIAGRGLAVVTTLRNLHETPVDVGDGETRDDGDDVDHDEDAPRRAHVWNADGSGFDPDEVPDVLTVRGRMEVRL